MKALAAKAAKEKGIPMGQFQGAFANLRALAVAASPLLYSFLYGLLSGRGAKNRANRVYFAAAFAIVVAEAIQRSIPDAAIKKLSQA